MSALLGVIHRGFLQPDFQDDYSLRVSSNNANTLIAMYSPNYAN